MHTVDLLDAAIRYAEQLGIRIREEWLDGANGGECEVAGKHCLFLDLSQSPQERLQVVAKCLRAHLCGHAPGPERWELPPELQAVLRLRRAA